MADTPNEKTALVLQVSSVSDETLAEICADHEARVTALSPSRRGRSMLLIYDLCGLQPFDWKRMLMPFITMKQRLQPLYERHLLCSIIVVDSTMAR